MKKQRQGEKRNRKNDKEKKKDYEKTKIKKKRQGKNKKLLKQRQGKTKKKIVFFSSFKSVKCVLLMDNQFCCFFEPQTLCFALCRTIKQLHHA